jgi:hypothetical protein
VPVKVHHKMMTYSQTPNKLSRKNKKTLMSEMRVNGESDMMVR